MKSMFRVCWRLFSQSLFCFKKLLPITVRTIMIPKMAKLFKKRNFILIGVFLGFLSLALPALTPLCQARAASIMASHPCCRNQKSCGPQLSSKPCCQMNEQVPRGQNVIASKNFSDSTKNLLVLPGSSTPFSLPKLSFLETRHSVPDLSPPGRFLLNKALLC